MVARHSSAQATALLRLTPRTTRRSSLQGLQLLLAETAKPAVHLDSATAQVATLQENSLARANRHLVEEDLDSRHAERDSVQARHPAGGARLQKLQLRPVADSPVPLVRAPRRLQCPDPYAFSRETPAARKCNRAARCDALPIFARYRPPRNRRALAGCDNKCSRSQRKRARRARPFPIVALDKCPCPPRRTAG